MDSGIDEFRTENFDDNEVYFKKADGLEQIRSLFDRLEDDLLKETLHDFNDLEQL